MALGTWSFDSQLVFDAASELPAGTKVLVVTGGAGWDVHSYTVQALTVGYNLGAQGVHNVAGLNNATGIPAPAGSSGGTGTGLVNGTRVAFVGNSLTAGTNIIDPADFYPRQCVALLGSSYAQSNHGLGGAITPTVTGIATTDVAPLGYEVGVAWEIGNDLYNDPSLTAAAAVQNFIDLCTVLKNAGYKVVILSVIPRVSNPPPSFWEPRRLAANALLADAFPTATSHPRVFTGSVPWADVLVDVASHPSLLDCTNPTYYTSDNIHITPAGAGVVAADVANGILAAQSLPPLTPTFTSTPADPSPAGGDVDFAFTSAGATSFECSIDGGVYATCTSPQSYTGLAAGAHTFAVRALNTAGTSSPASFSWTVSAPPLAPGTAVLGAGVGLRRGGRP